LDYIAKALDYADRSGARKAVERGRARWLSATEEELRALQLESLDVVGAALMSMIECDAPNLKAIDLYLKMWDRQVKLLGIGPRPPVPVQGTEPSGPTKGELVARWSELASKLASAAQMGYFTPADADDDDEEEDDAIAGRVFDSRDAASDNDDEDDMVEPMVWVDGRPVWGTWIDGKFVPSDRNDPDADSERPSLKREDPAAPVAEAFSV
jgi:hypothetical protein